MGTLFDQKEMQQPDEYVVNAVKLVKSYLFD
jgi:hypothetical protein